MTIQFMTYPAVNSDSPDTTLYGDIITHCKDWKHFAEAGSKYTTAHECTHGINNDLRLQSGDWDKKNGFYVGKNRAIVLDEPAIKKNQIIDYIPQELRSARYSLYVAGQNEWNDKPLYIYDEGVAYINGAWAAIELKEQENYVEKPIHRDIKVLRHLKPRTAGFVDTAASRWFTYPLTHEDAAGNSIVDGEVEFIPYMTAVLIATSIAVKSHLNIDTSLKDFSRWLFRHACNAYFRCQKDGFPAFDVQDKLWATMKTGECYSSQRAFLKNTIGFEFPDGEVPEDDPTPTPTPWYV